MANLLDQSVKAIEGQRVADIKSLKKELTKVQKEASNEDIKTMVSTLQKLLLLFLHMKTIKAVKMLGLLSDTC